MSKEGALSRHHKVLGKQLASLTPHWINRSTMSLEGNLVPNEAGVIATLSTPCRKEIEHVAVSASGAIAVAGALTKYEHQLVLFAPGSRDHKLIAKGRFFKHVHFPEGSDEPAYVVARSKKKGGVQYFVCWGHYQVQVTVRQGEKIDEIRFWQDGRYGQCLVAIRHGLRRMIKVYECPPHERHSYRTRPYGSNTLPWVECLGVYNDRELIKLAPESSGQSPCELSYHKWSAKDLSQIGLREELIAVGEKGFPQFLAYNRSMGFPSLYSPPVTDPEKLGFFCKTRATHNTVLYWTRGPGLEQHKTLESSDGYFSAYLPENEDIRLFVFDQAVVIAKKVGMGTFTFSRYDLTGKRIQSAGTPQGSCHDLMRVGDSLAYRDVNGWPLIIGNPCHDLENTHRPGLNFAVPVSSLVPQADGSIMAVQKLSEGSIAVIEVYKP